MRQIIGWTPRPLVACLTALWGCSGGDTGTTLEPAPTVSVTPGTVTLDGIGAESQLSATATPANTALTWTSDRPQVVAVTGSGTSARVVGVAPGNATITVQATHSSGRADARVDVQVVPIVRSIAIDSTAASLLLGQARQLRARVAADPGADTSVRWTSSAPAVLSVSTTGVITALGVGAARIEATSTARPAVSGNIQLTVVAPQVRGVTVAPQVDTVLVGSTRRFVATILADSGLATSVLWSSTAPGVATVANDGVATAVAVGTTNIVARSAADTARRAQATLVVRAPVVRALAFPALTGLLEREHRWLQATVDAEPGADARVTWTSSDTTVAVVAADGLLGARRAGSTTVTVQSAAFPAVRHARVVQVSPASPFLSWSRQAAGVVGALQHEGVPVSLLSRSATEAMVTLLRYEWPLPYDSVTMSLNGATWTAIAGNGMPVQAVTGLTQHGTNEVIGWAGNVAGSRRLVRWNGAWQAMPSPAVGIFDTQGDPQSLPGGLITTKTRDGAFDQIMLWNGSGWVELRRWGRPANPQGGSVWMQSPSLGYLHQNFQGGYTIVRFNAPTSMTFLPNVPTNNLFFPTFRGTAPDSLFVLGSADRRLFRWTGTSWITYDTGWPAATFSADFELCNGVPVVLMGDGRVYRLVGSQFVQLGTDDEALQGEPGFTTDRHISCAPDGTIRISASSGAISRWNGSSWVLETFAPRFTSVSAASATLAWAGSTLGRLYQWTGGTWQESYRVRGPGSPGDIRSIVSWADGRVVALRGNNVILRRDGGTWREETGSELTGVNAVWGPDGDLVFAVRNDGRIIQSVRGGAWQPVSPAGAALTGIDGVGPRHALAIGTSLRTLRWDGATWTEVVASVPSAFAAQRLHLSASNDAWVVAAASSSFSQSAARLLRFDGASWTQVDVSGIGGNDGSTGMTTLSLFGTGPSNVYALRGNARGPRTLYRFNGTSWSTITQLSVGQPDWVHLGSGVPGFALIAGSRGEIHASRPAQP